MTRLAASGARLRRLATDPFTPVLVLAAGGAAAIVTGGAGSWPVLGALAGYTLSGSV